MGQADDAPIDVSYDGGHFDKDEQGWVADPTRAVQVGPLLRVERSGVTTTFRLGRRYPHARVVVLEPHDPHPWFVAFDLDAGRLVGGRLPTSRSRPWRGSLPPLADPAAALWPLVASCAAGTRALFPASAVAAPASATFAAALAAALATPGATTTVPVPADPGPGLALHAWRREGPAVTGGSARTASPVGEPYAAVSVDAKGEVTVHVGAPTLDALDLALGAIDAALAAARA